AAVAARARQHAHGVAVGEQLADEVGPDEPGAAGDERVHGVAGYAVNAASRRATAASARWVAWRRAKARGSTDGRVTERARARAGRSLPASVTRPISSAGTSSPAASETPRTTRVGQPACAAQADRRQADGAAPERGHPDGGQRGQLEVAGEGPRFELNRGEDEDPGHS